MVLQISDFWGALGALQESACVSQTVHPITLKLHNMMCYINIYDLKLVLLYLITFWSFLTILEVYIVPNVWCSGD